MGIAASRRPRRAATFVVVVGALCVAQAVGSPAVADSRRGLAVHDQTDASWTWPLTTPHVVDAFVAPPHPYGPGHRGIDLRSHASGDVVAPEAGVVAFAGQVAGRGVITIDHGAGLVSTLEPVDAVVAAGEVVEAGGAVGTVATGGHTAQGALHFGIRLHGEYVNPLLMLGGVPRAVLLPCC